MNDEVRVSAIYLVERWLTTVYLPLMCVVERC